jgi:hypothetical protein
MIVPNREPDRSQRIARIAELPSAFSLGDLLRRSTSIFRDLARTAPFARPRCVIQECSNCRKDDMMKRLALFAMTGVLAVASILGVTQTPASADGLSIYFGAPPIYVPYERRYHDRYYYGGYDRHREYDRYRREDRGYGGYHHEDRGYHGDHHGDHGRHG